MYKILVADDEPLVHIAFRSFIDWQQHDCCIVGSAENGEQALAIYRQHLPDIVFTDIKMPVMDGLSLIEQIRQSGTNPVIIVLSGYDDFELVKHAFKLGILDYILKNDMTPDTILAAVRAAVKYRVGHRPAQNGLEESARYRYHPVDLWRAHSEKVDKSCTMCVFRILICGDDQAGLDRKGYKPLMERAVVEILTSTMERYGQGKAYFEPDNRITAIFSSHSVSSPVCDTSGTQFTGKVMSMKDSERLFEAFSGNMLQIMGLRIIAGVSDVQSGTDHIEQMYDQSDQALQASFYITGKRLIHYHDLSKDPDHISMLKLDKDQRLEVLARYLKKPEALDIEEVLNILTVSCTGLTVPMIGIVQDLFEGYAAILHNHCSELEYPSDILAKAKPPQIRSSSTTLDDLNSWLDHILRAIAAYNQVHHSMIRQVVQYLHQHIAEQMTLVDIARTFSVSSTYLSRLFSEIMGNTLIRYINELRIAKAKDLIKAGELRIYEVAERVGYHNVEYFYRLFREIEGCSPREYLAACKASNMKSGKRG